MALLDEIVSIGRGTSEARGVVAEIAEALSELGGSAHRDAVMDRIAVRRGEAAASESLKAELVTAFERHRAEAARDGRPEILHLPFGEGSRRWSLTRSGALGAPCVTATRAAA